MEFSLINLNRALFCDLGVDKKTSNYVQKRLLNEGESVVTVLLPAFSKHVLACIEQGYWTYFGSSVQISRGLPIIFRGYLLELFTYDPQSRLYVCKGEHACPVALWVIRQACEYSYKLALPFNKESLASAAAAFKATDSSVLSYGDYDENFVDTMRKNFISYYPTASKLGLNDLPGYVRPGPGTFAGSDSSWWMRNYQHPYIPWRGRDLAGSLRLNTASPKATITFSDPDYSEVLFVPKDSRGPRVIIREPHSKLMFQMGYNTLMGQALERDTRHRINFEDQSINNSLALESSISRHLSTLDLKDASDRVSFAIVVQLFRNTPLFKVLDWFRTPTAKLPDGELIPLKKLSGMGSGFTFPTMSLVIHLAICTQVSKDLRIPYHSVSQQVYVYGDDIIIPSQWYDLAVSALLRVGLVCNTSKCYKNSYFRESCGGDYYYGNDVAPVRLKLASASIAAKGRGILEASKEDFFLLGLERHARELVGAQLFKTADYIYEYLEKVLGPLPYVSASSHVLGRVAPTELLVQSLETFPCGTHKTFRRWVAKPINGVVDDACPYQYLRRSLRKVACDPWGSDGQLSVFGVASIPRTIRLVRRKVNEMGRL